MAINWARRACCGLTATRASPWALHTCILLGLLPSGSIDTAQYCWEMWLEAQVWAGESAERCTTRPWQATGAAAQKLSQNISKEAASLILWNPHPGFCQGLVHTATSPETRNQFYRKVFHTGLVGLQSFHKFSKLQHLPPGQPLPPGFWFKCPQLMGILCHRTETEPSL